MNLDLSDLVIALVGGAAGGFASLLAARIAARQSRHESLLKDRLERYSEFREAGQAYYQAIEPWKAVAQARLHWLLVEDRTGPMPEAPHQVPSLTPFLTAGEAVKEVAPRSVRERALDAINMARKLDDALRNFDKADTSPYAVVAAVHRFGFAFLDYREAANRDVRP